MTEVELLTKLIDELKERISNTEQLQETYDKATQGEMDYSIIHNRRIRSELEMKNQASRHWMLFQFRRSIWLLQRTLKR